MRFARLVDSVAAELVELPAGSDISQLFHPEIAETMVLCGEEVEEGWVYENGEFHSPDISEDLESVKLRLSALVDANAEAERLKYITAGAGQALTYMQKADEARRFLAEENPQPSDYPLLSAEIGITGENLAAVAEIVVEAYSRWQQIGAAIEGIRLSSKAAINAAESEAAAVSVVDGIMWPEPQSMVRPAPL